MVENGRIPSPSPRDSEIGRRWLARLLFDVPKKDFISCPICGALNDSLSVVCANDSSTLIGRNLDHRKWVYIVHTIRATAVSVALAVGYLHWSWPVYLFVCIGVLTFFILFHRNHQTARNYVLVLAAVGVLLTGILTYFKPTGKSLTTLLAACLGVMILAEQVFLVAFGRNIENDPRQDWLEKHQIDLHTGTLTWIALLLTFSLFSFVAYVVLTAKETGGTLRFFSLEMALVSLGLAATSCLVSSMIFTLRGELFSVPDRWHYKALLKDRTLKTWQVRRSNAPSNWRERIVATLDRIATFATNRFTELFEQFYNKFVVRFANRLAGSAVLIANLTRRAAMKTYLHTLRTLRRFKVELVWAVLWAIHVAKSYWKNFFFPISAILTCSILLFSIADDFFWYVHGRHVLLPLSIAWKVFVVFILLTISGSFVSHCRFFDFFEQVLATVSVFGPSAYLFFVLTAWIFGLFGHLTGGPYRIGWVTIICTVVLIAIFVRSQWRSRT